MIVKAAVTYKKNAPFVIKNVELDEPKEDEVLVKLVGCGVCHTDEAARREELFTPLPAVLGHEGAGIIEKVGSHVKELKVGDHVVFCQYSCGVCEQCISGHPAACDKVLAGNFLGTYIDGTKRLKDENGIELSSFFSESGFATYAVANQRNAIKIDDDMDLAIAGPLSCGIMTGAGSVMNIFKPEPGSGIAVFGCGGVGLSAIMAAKVMGCTTIIGVDAIPERLELATELGATDVINGEEVADLSKEIKSICGCGVENSFDTTAVPALIHAAISCLKRRGTAGLAAVMGSRMYNIEFGTALMDEARKLVGIVQGDAIPQLMIPQLINLYKAGLFPFDKLIKFYDFDGIGQAFKDSISGKTVKPVIKY